MVSQFRSTDIVSWGKKVEYFSFGRKPTDFRHVANRVVYTVLDYLQVSTKSRQLYEEKIIMCHIGWELGITAPYHYI